ncbi:MAG TPA: choice-of-anchor V domain-containing protein [Bacteroidota bacterium]|nr:choice-of-anchor V domain-containing protein [Bacteroidota bacterium]
MKFVCALLIFAVFLPGAAYSSANGITGRTLKSSANGCSCHNATAASSVLVLISGPASLAPGKSGTYTVTVADTVGTKGGVDIATSAGTLAPVSTILKLSGGELTHSAPGPVPSVYTFTLTAPATTGPVTLYATAKGSAFSNWNFAPNLTVTVSSTTAVSPVGSLPTSYALEQNFPNPFNPSTQIRFSVPEEQQVRLAVYDIQGRQVALLVNSRLQPGTYAAEWNAQHASTGVYFYRLTAGTFTETKKLLLNK